MSRSARSSVALRLDWHRGDDKAGVVKVVMTGSAADLPAWQPLVKRILRKYRYLPYLQDAAVRTVLEQAELLTERW